MPASRTKCPRAIAMTLAATLFGVAGTASAGGWTQPRGDYYLKLSSRTLVGTRAYLSTGLREAERDLPRFRDNQLNLYLEYGLIDQLTLVVFATPVGRAVMSGNSATYVGPTVGGLRWGFLRGNVNLALEAHYGYAPSIGDKPIYSELARQSDGTDELITYTPAVDNHLGELQFQIGHGFAHGGWIAVTTGVRFNSNDAIDTAFTGFVQYGYRFKRPWVLAAHLTLYEPFGAVAVTNIPGVGQTRYLGIGLSPSYWFSDHVAITFGVDGVFYASSNAATPAITLGLEFK